jgi:predicted transcriptional regulator
LKVGIASYEEMKARTMAVARGERRISADEPKIWFTSTESFAKILSARNRELLRVIAEKAPGSLDELAQITGKAKPVTHAAHHGKLWLGPPRTRRAGPITPKVMHDRVELDLPLTLSHKAEPRANFSFASSPGLSRILRSNLAILNFSLTRHGGRLRLLCGQKGRGM